MTSIRHSDVTRSREILATAFEAILSTRLRAAEVANRGVEAKLEDHYRYW